MTEHDHALRRLLLEARHPESAEAPSFNRLWSAARAQVEQPQPAIGRWGDTVSAAAAIACVLLIGLFLALHIRKEQAGVLPDPVLYEQLIAQTAWRSPTDVLLETPARYALHTVPELPGVNTNPYMESLL